MRTIIFRRGALFLAALTLLPSLVHAHVGVGPADGLVSGFHHPLHGLDHLCAMIAVGLWAAQMGGRAIWAVPATFLGVMALGGVLGMACLAVPFTETGIVISVLALGVLIAAAVRLPTAASVALVGCFALFHGQAHGMEMPESASGLAYAAGFVAATGLLHAAGIGLGIAIERFSKPMVVRLAGAAVVACGLVLLLG